MTLASWTSSISSGSTSCTTWVQLFASCRSGTRPPASIAVPAGSAAAACHDALMPFSSLQFRRNLQPDLRDLGITGFGRTQPYRDSTISVFMSSEVTLVIREQDDLDLAAVLAEHASVHRPWGAVQCRECVVDEGYEAGPSPWPCLPYRLACLALDLQGKVTRVEALRVLWDGDLVSLVADDVANALHQALTQTYRNGAALANQSEQEVTP